MERLGKCIVRHGYDQGLDMYLTSFRHPGDLLLAVAEQEQLESGGHIVSARLVCFIGEAFERHGRVRRSQFDANVGQMKRLQIVFCKAGKTMREVERA